MQVQKQSEVSEQQIENANKVLSAIAMSNPDDLIEGKSPNASPELVARKSMEKDFRRNQKIEAPRGSHLSIKKGQEIGEVSEGSLKVINRGAKHNAPEYGTADQIVEGFGRINGNAMDTLSEPQVAQDKVFTEARGAVLCSQGGEVKD